MAAIVNTTTNNVMTARLSFRGLDQSRRLMNLKKTGLVVTSLLDQVVSGEMMFKVHRECLNHDFLAPNLTIKVFKLIMGSQLNPSGRT